MEITHKLDKTVDSDNILIKDDSGNTIYWSDAWTAGPRVEAGESVHLGGFQSDSKLDPICEKRHGYTIIYQDDEGEALLVDEWTASDDPNIPSGPPSDSDGDGIPDWC